MSFRERVSWIALITTAFTWAAYFGWLAYLYANGHPDFRARMGLFAVAVVLQAVVSIVAVVVTAIRSPADARAPRDERDRAIERRAGAIAYQALIVAVACVAFSVHLGLHAIGVMNGIIGAIALGEFSRYGIQVVSYRRGWHG